MAPSECRVCKEILSVLLQDPEALLGVESPGLSSAVTTTPGPLPEEGPEEEGSVPPYWESTLSSSSYGDISLGL